MHLELSSKTQTLQQSKALAYFLNDYTAGNKAFTWSKKEMNIKIVRLSGTIIEPA